MVQLACPRCRTVVDVDPENPPPCPTCGFTGPAQMDEGTQPVPGTALWSGGAPVAPPARGPVKPYGGFWVRVVAYLIDGILLGVGFGLVWLIIAPDVLLAEPDPDAIAPEPAELVLWLSALVTSWLYQALLESSRYQATLGKMAVGLKVTDLSGRRISFARATGRHFGQYLSQLILLIGFFMIGWTRHKQGLHDFIADTVVYKKHQLPPPEGPSAPLAA